MSMEWRQSVDKSVTIDDVYRPDYLVVVANVVNTEGNPVPDMPGRCDVRYTDDTGKVVTRRILGIDATKRTLRIVTCSDDTPDPKEANG